MRFKDCVNADLKIFLNTDEFAELHTVDGVQFNIVVDNDKLKERQSKGQYGYEAVLLFYVKKIDLGDAPAVGQIINFDGDRYRVMDTGEDLGMYSITLESNMS